MNCTNTTKPLSTSPEAAARALVAASRRCTRNWSVPWVASVSATPPMSPVHSV